MSIGRREDSTTFDPIKSAQNADNRVFSNVFDVLVRVDKNGTRLEPGLAESWEISPDGKVYTFKMRDAKFSDGSPVTAQDAVFSLLRIREDHLLINHEHGALAKAGVTVNLQKVDPSQSWDMLVAGEYDISVMYWTNDILDRDQKITFVLGHDANMNYMTRYHNDKVKDLVAAARVEMNVGKRQQMYIDLQKTAKADVNWIDLYYSPYRNVSRKNIKGFYQNPLGRFALEDTDKL